MLPTSCLKFIQDYSENVFKTIAEKLKEKIDFCEIVYCCPFSLRLP